MQPDSPIQTINALRSPTEINIPIPAPIPYRNDLIMTSKIQKDHRSKDAKKKMVTSNSVEDDDIDEHTQNRPSSFSTLQRLYITNASTKRTRQKVTGSHNSHPSDVVLRANSKRSSICCNCAKILVVDDDPFNIIALESLLKSVDLKCEVSYHGQDAVDKILTRIKTRCSDNCSPFQMVFMDCNMPVMDGFEAVKVLGDKLDSIDRSELKVIGCTGYTSEEKIEKCMSSGMDDVISKPLSRQRLEEILNKYFK